MKILNFIIVTILIVGIVVGCSNSLPRTKKVLVPRTQSNALIVSSTSHIVAVKVTIPTVSAPSNAPSKIEIIPTNTIITNLPQTIEKKFEIHILGTNLIIKEYNSPSKRNIDFVPIFQSPTSVYYIGLLAIASLVWWFILRKSIKRVVQSQSVHRSPSAPPEE
jgi:hypothetical protein